MKMTIRKVFLILLFTPLITFLSAQSWTIKENQDGEIDFNQVISDFNTYWEGKTPGKGKGYKPMKRWEYRWQNRLTEEGKFPTAGYKRKTFENYLRNNEDMTRDVNDPWISLGPNSNTSGYAGTGRVMSIAWHPTNSDIIYVGSAGGGLWKTTNGGGSWSPKTDEIDAMGISAILLDPDNPNTIYIGTGDCDGADNYSIGVLKSTDGGDTWNTTGLDWTSQNQRLIYNMVFDPDNSDIILLASNNGIYRSLNAGSSWTQEISGSFRDIDFHPDGTTNTYYATTTDDIYRSTNNGDTWSNIETISGANRLTIATTEDNSDYLYVLASSGSNNGLLGIYRSTDGGDTFSEQVSGSDINLLGWSSAGTDTGGQGWYDLVIAADPNDAEVIHVGGVNHWKSTDGGVNWTIKSHWSGSGAVAVHADKHLLEYNGTTLWEGNDGGIYRTTDGGDTWIDETSDMVISQMYRVGIAETDERIMAGLQDNGSKLRNNDSNWTDEVGGDGMDCAINPTNSDVLYACIQNGNLRRSTNAGASWTDIRSNIPGSPTGAWVTPYLLDPSNPSTVIAGYRSVWKSTNQGNSWTNIGDNISPFNLNYLAISPTDANYIYAGRGSTMYRTSDGGDNWETISTPGSSTAMVKVSPSNPETIYAVRSSFSAGNKVYKSTNAGDTWTNISGSLPNLYANCIAIHDDGEETLYVGMDIGVYYKNNSTPEWTLFNVDLPNVEVKEIEIKETTNEIFLATYGRGVWKNNTIGESSLCASPGIITAENITANSADISWAAASDPPAEGYIWAYSTDGIVPSSTNPETGLEVTLDNLESGTGYYFHLRSDCGGGSKSAWSTFGPFFTEFGCDDTHYDTGGASGNYGNNEDEEITLCPSENEGEITLTFTSFAVESTWDALYIYDGDDTNAPLFDSGNPATQAGYPAGGYYGTDLPGPFTSTAASGCLTLKFLSDTYVTESGWAADITCAPGCNTMVSNLNDSGPGSLREVIDCIGPEDVVTFDPSLFGNTIILNTPILIESDVMIMIGGNDEIDISTSSFGPVFSIVSGGVLELDNININAGTGNYAAGINNLGTLILHNVEVNPNPNNPNANSIINNTGVLQVDGETILKE